MLSQKGNKTVTLFPWPDENPQGGHAVDSGMENSGVMCMGCCSPAHQELHAQTTEP